MIFMLPVATTLLVLVAVIWTQRRLSTRRAAARAAFMAAAPVGGTMDVPVRSTFSRGGGLMGGKAQNSLSPEFSVAPDGIYYRVLRRGMLPFGDIEHVDLRKTLLGQVLILRAEATGAFSPLTSVTSPWRSGCWPRYRDRSR